MIGTSENVNTDKQETNENHTAELDEINDTIEANSKMSVKPMIDKINTAIEVAQEITSKKPRAKKGTRTQHESVSRIVPSGPLKMRQINPNPDELTQNMESLTI